MIKYDNNINIRIHTLKKGGTQMDLPKELNRIVETIKTRVEREIPDKGYFRNFAENFDNIALFVERDEEREGRAFLGISVLHPQIKVDAATYLMNGDRESILKYLQDPELNSKLQEKITKLSDSLKDVR